MAFKYLLRGRIHEPVKFLFVIENFHVWQDFLVTRVRSEILSVCLYHRCSMCFQQWLRLRYNGDELQCWKRMSEIEGLEYDLWSRGWVMSSIFEVGRRCWLRIRYLDKSFNKLRRLRYLEMFGDVFGIETWLRYCKTSSIFQDALMPWIFRYLRYSISVGIIGCKFDIYKCFKHPGQTFPGIRSLRVTSWPSSL